MSKSLGSRGRSGSRLSARLIGSVLAVSFWAGIAAPVLGQSDWIAPHGSASEPSSDGHRQHRPREHADRRDPYRESVALRWNAALLTAVRAVRFAPMLTARALAIVHTCTLRRVGRLRCARGGHRLRRGTSAATARAHAWCQEVAVSYAAYRALVNLFPSQQMAFERLMTEMRLDSADESTDPSTPAGVGNAACSAVLAWRAHDGANQSG